MQAACRVFLQKGYADASMQDIASAVGVLKGSLYYYVESKEDLLWRIIDDIEAQSTKMLNEVLALEVPATELIRTYIQRYVEWCLDAPEVSVSLREWRQLSGEHIRIDESRRRRREQVVCHLISDAQAAGDVAQEVEPKHAARYVLAAVNAVPDWYRPSGSDSAARIAESFADMTVSLLTASLRSRS